MDNLNMPHISIKQIKVENFKSFKKLESKFRPFNVLIGANASGKSNFVNIFRLLKNIDSFGIDNAVSMQGGIEFLRNLAIGADSDVSVEVTVGPEPRKMVVGQASENELIGLKRSEAIYKFAVRSHKTGSGFAIVEDQLIQKGDFYLLHSAREKSRVQEKALGVGELVSSVSSGAVKTSINLQRKNSFLGSKNLRVFWGELKLPPKTLLLGAPFTGVSLGEYISIYDFDPKLPQKATPITGKAELEEDGSNLAIVLQKILESKAKRRQFSNLMSNLLPFIDLVDIEKFADRSLMLKVREKYFRDRFLPASSLSDGTINIAAIIVALYFTSHPLVIIEEPERNIHPSLISRIVSLMKDASRRKQVLVTTQNAEVVKHAGLENLLCVTRDKEGVSTIESPVEQREIKTFLENEIGIETLYVQNILECRG